MILRFSSLTCQAPVAFCNVDESTLLY